MNDLQQDKLLRINIVAKRLNIPIRTVYHLIATGELPAIRITARNIRVRASEVDNFLEKKSRF